jgi:hypothetical protein
MSMNVVPLPARAPLPVDFGTARRRSWLRKLRTPLWLAMLKVGAERMARTARRQHRYDNLAGVIFTADGEGTLHMQPNSNPVL